MFRLQILFWHEKMLFYILKCVLLMFKVKGWLFLFVSYLKKLIVKTIRSNLLTMGTCVKNCVCANTFFVHGTFRFM